MGYDRQGRRRERKHVSFLGRTGGNCAISNQFPSGEGGGAKRPGASKGLEEKRRQPTRRSRHKNRKRGKNGRQGSRPGEGTWKENGRKKTSRDRSTTTLRRGRGGSFTIWESFPSKPSSSAEGGRGAGWGESVGLPERGSHPGEKNCFVREGSPFRREDHEGGHLPKQNERDGRGIDIISSKRGSKFAIREFTRQQEGNTGRRT